MNYYAEFLHRKSFRSKILVQTHRRRAHIHTHPTDCSTWTIEMVGKIPTCFLYRTSSSKPTCVLRRSCGTVTQLMPVHRRATRNLRIGTWRRRNVFVRSSRRPLGSRSTERHIAS